MGCGIRQGWSPGSAGSGCETLTVASGTLAWPAVRLESHRLHGLSTQEGCAVPSGIRRPVRGSGAGSSAKRRPKRQARSEMCSRKQGHLPTQVVLPRNKILKTVGVLFSSKIHIALKGILALKLIIYPTTNWTRLVASGYLSRPIYKFVFYRKPATFHSEVCTFGRAENGSWAASGPPGFGEGWGRRMRAPGVASGCVRFGGAGPPRWCRASVSPSPARCELALRPSVKYSLTFPLGTPRWRQEGIVVLQLRLRFPRQD